jgi:hypothetical protein
MSVFKQSKIGVYGEKDRKLQKSLSFEKTALTHKTMNVYKYLGSRTNDTPAITDVSDPIFLEVADRAYSTTPIEINCWFETLPESMLDLSRFGILDPLGDFQQFRVHINSFAADSLGRYLHAADVIEIPFLEEEGRKSFWEIEDVDRKTVFENFFVIINAKPILDSGTMVEIPDIPSNSDILQAIEDNRENLADAIVHTDGVAFGNNLVAPGYIAQGYYVSEDDDYDPRPDDAETFLDDPTSEIF